MIEIVKNSDSMDVGIKCDDRILDHGVGGVTNMHKVYEVVHLPNYFSNVQLFS